MENDNNEVDECGTGRESPPSYNSSIRQRAEANANLSHAINLNTFNNRTWKNCLLCQCCHKDRVQQSKETTESLNSIANILESYLVEKGSNFMALIVTSFWIGLVYCLYAYLTSVTPSYVIEEEYQTAFANANITEEIQKILLEGTKKRIVDDFKKCILTKL